MLFNKNKERQPETKPKMTFVEHLDVQGTFIQPAVVITIGAYR